MTLLALKGGVWTRVRIKNQMKIVLDANIFISAFYSKIWFNTPQLCYG
jgi:hypothetical protein